MKFWKTSFEQNVLIGFFSSINYLHTAKYAMEKLHIVKETMKLQTAKTLNNIVQLRWSKNLNRWQNIHHFISSSSCYNVFSLRGFDLHKFIPSPYKSCAICRTELRDTVLKSEYFQFKAAWKYSPTVFYFCFLIIFRHRKQKKN